MDKENQQKTIPLDQLSPQQLVSIKKNIEEEVQILNNSMNSFKVAASKYEESKQIIQNLDKLKSDDNQEILIPITNSLYVPGYLQNNKTLLIDFGTGYFVERNLEQSQKFCERKLILIRENAEKLQNVIVQKLTFVDKINQEVQKKVQQVQQGQMKQKQ